jgi:glycosyltransferase involved in cell wall biosynthesis
MRVLMLDPDPVGYYGTDLCNSLTARDVEIKLLTAHGYMHRERLRCSCAEVAPHSGPGRQATKLVQEARYLVRLFQEAFRWRPDVVHVQWLRLPIEVAAIALLRALRFRIVWTAHNALPHERERVAMGVQALLYRLADEIVVHTGSTRDEVARSFGVPPKRIHVVPHGLHRDPDRESLPSAEARRVLGLPEGGVLFLFFGQFRAYKGYENLIAAFSEAARAGVDIHLVLAGRASSERAANVRARVESLPPAARARVHSRVSVNQFLPRTEMDALFSACDCVVLPYTEISQSGVLYQAFGHERPVIASRVGGFAEVIEEGRNGLLFEARDVCGLARLLATWGARKSALAAMGQAAKSMALQGNSWDKVAVATREVYRLTLRGNEAA